MPVHRTHAHRRYTATFLRNAPATNADDMIPCSTFNSQNLGRPLFLHIMNGTAADLQARSISTSCPASNSTTPCCRASVLVSWYTSSVATSTPHPSRFLQHTDGARLVTLGAGSGCSILHAQVNRKARKPKPHSSFACFLMRFHPCRVLRTVVRSSKEHTYLHVV
ncbi:hypothetical protein DENSPDRAFT_871120 [Dentipellis sp. KUC8613]|nr:hypothetical protein DENSPDRAFT_871120 [Dentipellis sp. KUC8613]